VSVTRVGLTAAALMTTGAFLYAQDPLARVKQGAGSWQLTALFMELTRLK